jgi:methionine-rich copper-binding protein CopC
MTRHALWPAILAIAAATGAATHARAHSYLVRSNPAADTIVAPPSELRLVFGEKLEPNFAHVSVSVDGVSLADAGHPAVAADRVTVSVALPHPKPGHYVVSWSVVARDGHRTAGTYAFEAKPTP